MLIVGCGSYWFPVLVSEGMCWRARPACANSEWATARPGRARPLRARQAFHAYRGCTAQTCCFPHAMHPFKHPKEAEHTPQGVSCIIDSPQCTS